MHHRIVVIYLKLFYRFTKNVRFLKNSKINSNTFLEGNNSIGENSSIYNSNLGYGTYTGSNTHLNKVKIGRYCSIASNTKNITGRHPTDTYVSTHPCFFSIGKAAGFTFSKSQKFQEIRYTTPTKEFINEIGNDVWIGENVLIMDGVKIGDGAIIGAYSLVTRNIDPFTINIGIPVKTVKMRFTAEQIKVLLQTQWWNKEPAWLKDNSNLFEDIDIYTAFFNKK